jgi:hypothetical protein
LSAWQPPFFACSGEQSFFTGFFPVAAAVVFFLLEMFRVLVEVPLAEPVLVAVCTPVPVLTVEPVVDVLEAVPPVRVFKTGPVAEAVVEVPVLLLEVLDAGPATAAVLLSGCFAAWL